MDKKIVLITGTSSGFGFLTTLHLAALGYYVIATMRNMDKMADLIKEAEKRQLNNFEVVKLDVTNRDDILNVKDYIVKKFGKLDILINNAGYCLGGLVEYAQIDEWDMQFKTNVISVIEITKAFIPLMREKRSGKIINLGSVSGRFGFPGLAAYVTSKYALSGFSESLRLELIPFNIYVSIIEPGSYKTNIWEKSLTDVNLQFDQDYESFFNFVFEQARQTANNAADPQKVVNLIGKICGTKKPRLRYPIGKSAHLLILIKRLLPWSIVEKYILNKFKNHIN